MDMDDNAVSSFCIYELPHPQDSLNFSFSAETETPEALDTLDMPNSPAGHDGDAGGLVVLASNLSQESELNLRDFIRRRIIQNLLPETYGDVAKLPSASFFMHTVVYFVLLRTAETRTDSDNDHEKEKEDDDTDLEKSLMKQFTQIQVNSGRHYVLCLLHDIEEGSDEGFDLFRSECDNFAASFREFLNNEMNVSAGDTGKFLSRWKHDCIYFMSRAFASLAATKSKSTTSQVLHSALVGSPIRIDVPHSAVLAADDLGRVCSMLRVFQFQFQQQDLDLEMQMEMGVGVDSPNQKLRESGIYINIVDSGIVSQDDVDEKKKEKKKHIVFRMNDVGDIMSVFPATSNHFCAVWAEKMLRKAADPIKLRALVDACRFNVIQDLNMTKRLTTQAVLSNYALYVARDFLNENENSDVLLDLLLLTDSHSNAANDGSTSTSSAAKANREVVMVLQRFVSSNSGTIGTGPSKLVDYYQKAVL